MSNPGVVLTDVYLKPYQTPNRDIRFLLRQRTAQERDKWRIEVSDIKSDSNWCSVRRQLMK
jgi:predicted ATP-dependent Lon-type protease